MSGLEPAGVPGPEHLRAALTNCTDPLAAIEEFQVENGILLPSLRPALPFLDLHDVRRFDFHQSAMEELRDRLLLRVKELAESDDKNKQKILNELLDKSFPLINVKSLRPVVLCVMKHLPTIKQEYLERIVDDQQLYKESATEVKQKIWEENQAMFGDEVSPLLSKYIETKESHLLAHERPSLTQTFFSPSPKTRRQGEIVQQLTSMVGKNVRLYDMVLQFLRTLFLRTRNVHYCTLRAELLMALHDLEIHEICSVDPCHKFTWCLDACIRERFIDSKRSRELQGFLDGIRRSHQQVLGDLSMILCDPYALNTICLSIMKAFQHSANTETLPRENGEVLLLLRMLALGLNAWQMIDSQVFKEPKLDSSLVTKFMSCIVGMIVDDHLNAVIAKIPDEPPIRPGQVLHTVVAFAAANTICSVLLMYYALHVSRLRDSIAVTRIMSAVAQGDGDTVYQDTTLHSLVTYLSLMVDDFAKEEFCASVFDGFFMPAISRENVLRHMLCLLSTVHHKVPVIRLKTMMEMIQPDNDHSEPVHQAYLALQEKMSVRPPSPTVQPKTLDSPLMSVPAPTPAHP